MSRGLAPDTADTQRRHGACEDTGGNLTTYSRCGHKHPTDHSFYQLPPLLQPIFHDLSGYFLSIYYWGLGPVLIPRVTIPELNIKLTPSDLVLIHRLFTSVLSRRGHRDCEESNRAKLWIPVYHKKCEYATFSDKWRGRETKYHLYTSPVNRCQYTQLRSQDAVFCTPSGGVNIEMFALCSNL